VLSDALGKRKKRSPQSSHPPPLLAQIKEDLARRIAAAVAVLLNCDDGGGGGGGGALRGELGCGGGTDALDIPTMHSAAGAEAPLWTVKGAFLPE